MEFVPLTRVRARRVEDLESNRQAYERALLAGDGEASNAVIEELLTRRLPLGEIYAKIIRPALASIGDLWCSKDITVADEHLASQIVLSHLDRLVSVFAWRDRPSFYRVLVGCLEGERHWIGARMFADLCLSHGWSAEFLGPDVPSDALIEMVKKRPPQVVALSATMAQGEEQAHHVIRTVSSLANPPRIILGGQAIMKSAAGRFGPACVIASDATDGLEMALKFLRASRPKVVLKEYLLAVGRRLRDLRLKKGWTQEQLAETARVTRVCIVAVEGGKQNVSMDIVVRLANALGVAPQALLIDGATADQI
jgi:methanogenic corrinoid protein MtbC1/DNA-binding XRE family transcriptional regulator